ncbi:MAG: recombinase family protein [Micrococcales bacterium]|nr:recombinase family protein [Micrococcales bacterium]
MARVGYIWVSVVEHNAQFQRDLLQRRGVDRLYEDISERASAPARVQLTAALDEVGPGDSLVVWRLDRLGSTVTTVLSLVELLGRRNVGVTSLAEGLDTSGEDGAVLLRTISAFTELDRQLARARTMAGVYAARDRGRVGGRPRALSSTNIDRVLMLKEQGATVREIAEEMGTSRATVYRVLDTANLQPDREEPPSLVVRLPTGIDLDADRMRTES